MEIELYHIQTNPVLKFTSVWFENKYFICPKFTMINQGLR